MDRETSYRVERAGRVSVQRDPARSVRAGSLELEWCALYDKRQRLLDQVSLTNEAMVALEQHLTEAQPFPPAGGVS